MTIIEDTVSAVLYPLLISFNPLGKPMSVTSFTGKTAAVRTE